MKYIIYVTKLRLISGVDLYGLLFFVSGLLIMHFSVYVVDKYALHLRKFHIQGYGQNNQTG